MPDGVPGVPSCCLVHWKGKRVGVQETWVVLGASKGRLISQYVYSDGDHIRGKVKEWLLMLISLIGPVLFQGRLPHRASFCCCNHCLDYTTASSTFSHAAALSPES